MKKTLILVVDRDDDFGAKGSVKTPVIGIDACAEAATALGVADPEDSDTNALYAAMNIYREMEKDGEPAGSFEVALICGDQKVGYKSDGKIVDELNEVLDKVNPNRAILVGDGAEDEYVYPIISSRVSIDSVRKVYVKQAPGVEGTFYIIQKTLSDPQKRERFLAPVSWILMLISSIYIAAGLIIADDLSDFFISSTTLFIVFFIGVMLALYSYSVDERLRRAKDKWAERAKRGSVTVIFSIGGLALMAIGVVIGFISLTDYYTTRTLQRLVLFVCNALWPVLFGIILIMGGTLLDRYMNSHVIKYRFITHCLDIVAIGMLLTGAFDFVGSNLDLGSASMTIVLFEIIGGFVLFIAALVLQHNVKEAMGIEEKEATKDEVL
ncbi:DUF373 family protein [Methanomethylophilus alvi]|uniref:DUF373 family protein n=1 Tax=Methanomethylophilus alvi TaxID=1291540 RepID=UPI0037DC3DC2